MSAMTNINLKYPITLREDMVNIKDVPSELFCERKDSRRYNRTLCKLDMIKWYINNDHKPDQNTIDIIEKLFSSNAKRYKIVSEYDLGGVTFKIGNVSLQRMLVSVNPNGIDIPKELIKPAILHALGLSNMIDYNPAPPHYLNQISKIVQDSNLDIRKIPNLLNYIQSQIDKRFRHLPVISGMTPEFVYINHALIQPQYKVQNLVEFSSEMKGQNLGITLICMSLIWHCQQNKVPYSKLRELVQTIKVNDYPLNKLLLTTDENKFTRFCRQAVM